MQIRYVRRALADWTRRIRTALAGGAAAEAPATDTNVVTASLELASLPGCGSEAELAGAIVARSDRIRIVPSDAATRALRIELRNTGNGLVATLGLTLPSGRRSTRTLRAANCAEALDAAALVAAVSLDPTARATPSGDGTANSSSDAPRPAPSAAPPKVAPCAPCAEATPKSPTAPGVRWSATVAFEALWAPAPEVMPGFALGVMLADAHDLVFSPAVRLSYAHFARGGFATAAGTADFSLDVGTLELCPLRAAAGPLSVYPCLLRVTGGELDAAGLDTLAPRSRGRPWWVVGSSLVLLLRPTPSLELGATVALGRPLVRDRFQFEPLEFHRVSALALGLALAAGASFP